MTEDLFRAIYVSTATRDLGDEVLISLLEVSRRNNAARDITGALSYHDRSFIQVLEGPQGPVEALLGTIGCDTRNTGMLFWIDRGSTSECSAGGPWVG